MISSRSQLNTEKKVCSALPHLTGSHPLKQKHFSIRPKVLCAREKPEKNKKNPITNLSHFRKLLVKYFLSTLEKKFNKLIRFFSLKKSIIIKVLCFFSSVCGIVHKLANMNIGYKENYIPIFFSPIFCVNTRL